MGNKQTGNEVIGMSLWCLSDDFFIIFKSVFFLFFYFIIKIELGR